MLPPLDINQVLELDIMKAKEGFSRHSARYTEASLVKKLEELGIGRPSTYAPTISTIQKRDYVIKESREGTERKYKEAYLRKDKIEKAELTEITGAENNKLFPTNIAMVVNDFLVENFPNVIDFTFTAKVEKEFDDIALGNLPWDEMIANFYGGFHAKVEDTELLKRSDVSNSSRELGKDPKTGKTIIARLGKFGPMVQLGETPENDEDEKPQYASMRKGQFIENMTLDDALELFKLPRELGMFEDKNMVAAVGRFGPYIRHDSKFVSLPKGVDPLSITAEEAIDLIQAKRKSDAEKFIKEFEEDKDVQVLNGRYGPYIKFGKKNLKIPKDMIPEDLTYEQCVKINEETPEKKGRFAKKKSK
jgi:DNA topoisomerase-1